MRNLVLKRQTATALVLAGMRKARALQKRRDSVERSELPRACRAHSRGIVFAHVRASTGTPVQRSNCHPFRHGRWLWMHNGLVRGFHDLKRDLAFAVDPSLYPEIDGSTDSEMLFFLALTFGLEDDPITGVPRASG